MSRGVNKVILVGRLGQDPELRYLPNGTAVTSISVATGKKWRDKDGQTQERTEWHRVVMFGKLAEIAAEYLKQGREVYIDGENRTRKWQGKDGQDRHTTEVIANEMQMLGGGQSKAPDQPTAPPADGAPDFDDDVPF